MDDLVGELSSVRRSQWRRGLDLGLFLEHGDDEVVGRNVVWLSRSEVSSNSKRKCTFQSFKRPAVGDDKPRDDVVAGQTASKSRI